MWRYSGGNVFGYMHANMCKSYKGSWVWINKQKPESVQSKVPEVWTEIWWLFFMWMQFTEVFVVLLCNAFVSGAFFSLFHVSFSSNSLCLMKCRIIIKSMIVNLWFCYSEAKRYHIYVIHIYTYELLSSNFDGLWRDHLNERWWKEWWGIFNKVFSGQSHYLSQAC